MIEIEYAVLITLVLVLIIATIIFRVNKKDEEKEKFKAQPVDFINAGLDYIDFLQANPKTKITPLQFELLKSQM